ncbi:hypothetical protein OSB04_023164 [Centaurea solstitialis]|uniref:J domain-containing protein n=1 Tax=Centaurea solstitialis TaxID=347529 RepID=A0AA38VZC3_9ASTR|nr:hypothetical protein OSB04_023164 [Centaurea solstitialis]
MISSKPTSSIIQTHFHDPSNLFTPSQSHHISFNFINTHLKKPLISIRKPLNLRPTTATINDLYTSSQEETLYDLLGISVNGTLSDIKQAYKQMALKYHPDVSPPEHVHESTMMFIRIQEAYKTLSDPDARAMYDGSISKGLHLVFSRKKGCRSDTILDDKTLWKKSWQEQVLELKRRSMMNKVSWGSRARKRQSESCESGSNQDQ